MGVSAFFDTYFITAVTLALILRRSKKVWRLAIDFDRPPPARPGTRVSCVKANHFRSAELKIIVIIADILIHYRNLIYCSFKLNMQPTIITI